MEIFEMTREFAVPRERLFQAWTRPEQLTRWWGPKGFTIESLKLEVRPGGLFHYSMRAPGGQLMWGRLVYKIVEAPEKLAYVTSFSDEKGGVTRHPMSPNYPLEVRTTLTFTEAGGRTTLGMRSAPLNAPEADRRTFEDGQPSLQKGVSDMLDQLDALLAGG